MAAPTTWQAGKSNDPVWEEILEDFNKSHKATYGVDMNRSWDSDEDAKRQYQALARVYESKTASATPTTPAAPAVNTGIAVPSGTTLRPCQTFNTQWTHHAPLVAYSQDPQWISTCCRITLLRAEASLTAWKTSTPKPHSRRTIKPIKIVLQVKQLPTLLSNSAVCKPPISATLLAKVLTRTQAGHWLWATRRPSLRQQRKQAQQTKRGRIWMYWLTADSAPPSGLVRLLSGRLKAQQD